MQPMKKSAFDFGARRRGIGDRKAEEMLYRMNYDSPLGDITVVSDGKNIVELWLAGQRGFCRQPKGAEELEKKIPALAMAVRWLDRYFAGDRPTPDELPIAPVGGSFRQEVWKILRGIPYGEMMTYGEIARRIADNRGIAKMAAQAVGGAVGHNPISIVIPCHRVVGTGGNLTGYGGGIALKQALLAHEGVDLSGFYVPAKCGKKF